MPADATRLTTSEVSDLLGIHPSTVKRWFGGRRRGTPGGHRRIPLDVVLAVALERGRRVSLHDFGPDAGRVWRALKAADARDAAPVRELLLDWIRVGRPRLAGRLLRLAAGDAARVDPWILDEVFGGLLRCVGAGWEEGALGIGDERAASREVAEAVYSLLEGAGTQECPRGRAVVATADGSQHELGSLMVRLVLAGRGWRVEYLGTGMPAREVVAVQRAAEASLVCVSFIQPQGRADVRRFVRAMAAATGGADAASDGRSGGAGRSGGGRSEDAGRAACGHGFALLLGGAGTTGLAEGEVEAEAARAAGRAGRAFSHLAALPSLAALDGWLEGLEGAR